VFNILFDKYYAICEMCLILKCINYLTTVSVRGYRYAVLHVYILNVLILDIVSLYWRRTSC
jgi:hypothetical protein